MLQQEHFVLFTLSATTVYHDMSNDADETRLNVMAEKFSLVQEPTQFDV